MGTKRVPQEFVPPPEKLDSFGFPEIAVDPQKEKKAGTKYCPFCLEPALYVGITEKSKRYYLVCRACKFRGFSYTVQSDKNIKNLLAALEMGPDLRKYLAVSTAAVGNIIG